MRQRGLVTMPVVWIRWYYVSCRPEMFLENPLQLYMQLNVTMISILHGLRNMLKSLTSH